MPLRSIDDIVLVKIAMLNITKERQERILLLAPLLGNGNSESSDERNLAALALGAVQQTPISDIRHVTDGTQKLRGSGI